MQDFNGIFYTKLPLPLSSQFVRNRGVCIFFHHVTKYGVVPPSDETLHISNQVLVSFRLPCLGLVRELLPRLLIRRYQFPDLILKVEDGLKEGIAGFKALDFCFPGSEVGLELSVTADDGLLELVCLADGGGGCCHAD